MLFRIKSYIEFLWHSKNEHAVHSPFVFQLVTKCFYSNKEKLPYFSGFSTKTNKEKLLNRLFHYFQFRNGLFLMSTKETDQSIVAKYDFVIIDIPFFIEKQIDITKIIAKSHNETCFVFDSIYKNKETQMVWKSIVSNPKFSVSIDTFKFGFAFIRKEQEKEHFVIRV